MLLTFTSDGTLFQIGDTPPWLSAAHGAWVPVYERVFEATYIALWFDEKHAPIGNQKTLIQIRVLPDPNQFMGFSKTSTLSREGSVEMGEVRRLHGQRINVEPFREAPEAG